MKILIVESAYRKDIINNLVKGATAELEEAGASYDRVEVHGSLEIPGVIAYAEKFRRDYDGYIAIGCILKGETIHDEVIAYAAYEALQKMAVEEHLAIGCGILTVNTLAQAEERADPQRQNRGAEAARAALQMIEIRRKFKDGFKRSFGFTQ